MAITTTIKKQKVNVGDMIKVHHKIVEDEKIRTQVFQGIVIAIKGKGMNKSFTMRKISSANIGVERIWPINSPQLSKIEVVEKGLVRKSKLYYLRLRSGKEALKVKVIEKSKKAKKSKIQAKSKPTKSKSEETKPRGKGRSPSS